MVTQMLDVAFAAREEIVDADDLMTLLDQSVDQMRTEKSGAAGDQNALTTIAQLHRYSLGAHSGVSRSG
jgi:hypothetical protein